MVTMLVKYLCLVLFCIFVASCDGLVGPDPQNTPENNFEILWKEIDQDYSFFVYRGINWDSLYGVYRPQITRTTDDRALFDVMSSLLGNLKDGHVNLYSPYGDFAYTGWYAKYPTNFNMSDVRNRYLVRQSVRGAYLYGTIGDSLGYVYIGSFGNGGYGEIDEIVGQFQSMRGVIIDVRNNGGGSSDHAEFVAQRFIDERTLIRYVQWRNGPKHSDFTDYIPTYIDPAGVRFTKRVALLTNRRCFSSTEDFVAALRKLPHVTVIGDTTGGGSGNPIYRELANGWTYRVPRWIGYTRDKQAYEGKGLVPDVAVWISKADSSAGRDPILQRAIDLLSR